jgi:hypothetical protein
MAREVYEDVNTILAYLLKKSLVGEIPDFPPITCSRSDFISGRVLRTVVAVAKHLKGIRVVTCQKRLKKERNWVFPKVAGDISDFNFLRRAKPERPWWDRWKLACIEAVCAGQIGLKARRTIVQ